MQIGLFSLLMTKENDFVWCPDSQIAKGYELNETKMKYIIQSGIAPYFKDLLKDDLKKMPYSFKFDETATQQAAKR